ncbi:hypothetical protein sos41_09530 [Alphaproteobacteria bacterium SO-S41]|nr:hypothetical protein sos41_09530 [Alphaproteobacteria bacterium SO-S41]
MIRHTGLAAAAALSLALGACATTPLYAPQVSERSAGYAEQKLDNNQYRVSFTGRRSTSRARVEDGLMLRAAEVTQQSGFSHFIIATRETEQERTGPRRTFMGGPEFFGMYGFGYGRGRYGWYDPFWYNVGWYDNDRYDDRFVATADIAMLSTAEARGNPQAVDAAEVIANLRDKVSPPGKP